MENPFAIFGVIFLVINVMAFLIMGFDKLFSKKEGQVRISEGAMFFMAIVFGSIGVYTGMFVFRHKTRHWYFVVGIPILILEHVALLYALSFFK